MGLFLELTIAFRYLRSKKRESVISVIAGFSLLGVALGVAALIVVMSVMNGFHVEISSKMTGFKGDINIYNHNGDIENFDNIVTEISQVEHVYKVTPMVEAQVMAISKNGGSSGAMVTGIRSSDLADKLFVSNNIIRGNINDFKGSDNIIIGSALADNLHVTVGDALSLISPQGITSIMGFVPRNKMYHIVGIFKASMYIYDSSVIFMPLEASQIFTRLSNKVNSIEVMTTNLDYSSLVAKNISGLLGPDYRVDDWKISNASYFEALKTERVAMFVILTLIIIIAAFNIISSLIMLVKDKAKSIAILRTMGASKAMILRIFIISGSFIGLVGTIIGAILGIAFALNIEKLRLFLEKITGLSIFDPLLYYLYSLPVELKSADTLKIILMSLTLSFCATIYPAWKAANTDPVQGLRYE